MKRNFKAKVPNWLKWIFSAVALALIVKWIDISVLSSAIVSAKLHYLFYALVLVLAGILLNAAKVSLILCGNFSMLPAVISVNFIGILFKNLFAGIVADDLARAYYLKNEMNSISLAGFGLIFDRLTGIIIQCVLAYFSLVYISIAKINMDSKQLIVLGLIGAIFFIGVGAAGIIIYKADGPLLWLQKKIGKIANDKADIRLYFRHLFSDRKRLTSIIAIGLFYNLTAVAVIYNVTRAIGGNLTIYETPVVLLFTTIAAFIPVSIGGWGIVELIFSLSYHYLNAGKELGLSVSLIIRIIMLVPSLVGLVLFLIYRQQKKSGALQ